ncbi:MAG: hypothetical protein NC048_09565 [Bacteroides sp.]|nr:hypothetical protein [Bacteroides sp.]
MASYFCSKTDTVVDKGTPIKFRLYLSGKILWQATVTHNFYQTSPVPLNYAYAPMQVYWQVLDKATNTWNTWDITPNSAYTQLLSNSIHYVESSPTIIQESGTYRAVVSLAQDCKTITTTGDNSIYANDSYSAGKKDDKMWTVVESVGAIGTYADVANVTLKTNIIPGTIKGRVDGGSFQLNSLDMCFSSVADLKVEDFGVPVANLTWQQQQEDGSFKDVAPAVTGDTYTHVAIGSDDNDLYTGRMLTFRVKATDGAGGEAFTDPFSINVYKAKALTVVNASGVVKDTVAGYCFGSTVNPRAQEGSSKMQSLPAGVKGLALQYVRTNNISSWTFPDNGNYMALDAEYQGSDVLNQYTWNLYRAVSYNGPSGSPTLCRANGSPIVIKMNPQVRLGSLNSIAEVCAGLDTTLTASGGANASVYNWSVYKGSSLDNTYPDQGTTLRRSYESGDYTIRVDGHGVFGNRATRDTTVCPASFITATVKAVVCTKSAPVPEPAAICVGTDGILNWMEEFNSGQTLQISTDGTVWSDVPADKFSHEIKTGSASYTQFTVSKDILPVGSYYFRVNEGVAQGETSTALTVKALPTITATDFTINTESDDVAVCAGEKVDFAVTVETGATYKWTTDPDDASKTVSTANPYSIASAATGNSGTYSLVITKTVDGCPATKPVGPHTLTVNAKPAEPSVSVANGDICAGKEHKFEPVITNSTAYPKPVTYTWTWTNGTAPAGTTSGASNKDYTVATSASLASTTTYTYTLKVDVEMEGCTNTKTFNPTLKVNALPDIHHATVAIANNGTSPICGLNGSLTVTAYNSSNAPIASGLSYQWESAPVGGSNWTDISGATGSTLALTSQSELQYRCKVTMGSTSGNAECSDTKTSNELTVKVLQKPGAPTVAIAADPKAEVCAGTDLTLNLSVTPASGDPASTTYTAIQWSKDGTDFSAGNSHTITGATATAAGKYQVVVTADNDGCTTTGTGTLDLKVNALPAISNSQLVGSDICSGATLSLTATASSTGTPSYIWYKAKAADVTDGTPSIGTGSKFEKADAQVADGGDYAVKITYTSAAGCEASVIEGKTITVTKTPEISLAEITSNPTPATICAGQSIEFSTTLTKGADNDAATSYTQQWYNGTAPVSGQTAETLSLTNTVAGDYTYVYKVSANVGGKCPVNIDESIALKVNANPSGTKVEVPDVQVCSDATLSLTATASATTGSVSSYEWYLGDAATGTPLVTHTSTSKTDSYSPAMPTVNPSEANKKQKYTVKAIFGANGCNDAATATAEVTVTQTPKVSLAAITADPNKAEICAGESIEFSTTLTKDADNYTGTVYTTQWYNGSTPISGQTAENYTYGPAVAGTNPYTFKYRVDAVNGTCKDDDEKTVTLKVNPTPVITNPRLTPDAAAICSGEQLKLTATATVNPTDAVPSYEWYHAKYADINASNKLAYTGSAYTVGSATTADAGDYTVVITFKVGDCPQTAYAETSVSVTETPVIGSVGLTLDNPSICAGKTAAKFTASEASVAPATATPSYEWKFGSTVFTPSASDKLSHTIDPVAKTHDGTYTFTVTATNGTAPAKVCSAEPQSATATLTVTEPADLSNLAINGNENPCLTKDDGSLNPQTLQVDAGSMTLNGGTPAYKWTDPKGNTVGTNSPSYTVPAALANNGEYSCEVTVTNGPCTIIATAKKNIEYKMCGNEPLTPGNVAQNATLAMVCQKGGLTGSTVSYEPIIEKDAVTKVTWYRYGTQPNDNSTDLGDLIKEVTSFSWPLVLTQQEVFGSTGTAPLRYYVRAKVERGSTVSFTKSYLFVKVENPGAATPVTKSDDETVCVSTTDKTISVQGTKPDAKTSPYTGWGINASSGNLTYIWTLSTGTVVPKGETHSVNISAAGTYTNSAKAVSSFTYTITGASQTCYDTTGSYSVTLTVVDKPEITAFAGSKTICSNDSSSDYPLLKLEQKNGTDITWKWNDGTTDHTLATPASGEYQLTANEIKKPAAGGADVVNTYTVTVGNGGTCPSEQASYTLTVKSEPAVTNLEFTNTDFKFCNSGTLAVKAKNGSNDAVTSGLTLTYKWEKSPTGADGSWTTVGGNTPNCPVAVADNGNYFRCTLTVAVPGSNGCSKEVESPAQQVTVSAPSDASTLSSATDVCVDVVSSNYPTFNFTGSITGEVQKWEISNGTTTIDGKSTANSFVLNPKSTDPDIASLLTSRNTTLTVTATVKSGTCTEDKASGTVTIYKPLESITATPNVTDACNLAGTTVRFTPQHNAAFEEVKWEFVGGTDKVNPMPANANTETTTNLNFNATHQPKYEDDTTYTVRVTVTNTKATLGCTPVVSELVTFKANRASVKPALTGTQPACEDGSYTVAATRPAKSALVWKVSKDGAAATTVTDGLDVSALPAETLTVSNVTPGVYTYTVTDQANCPAATSDPVTVTVHAKPTATGIDNGAGQFCSSTEVKVTATVFTPASAASSIKWQVSTSKTDPENNRVAALENHTGATYASENGFTAGQDYYIRYEVPATVPCDPAYSEWVSVRVFEAPSVTEFKADKKRICVDDEITLSFKAKEGMEYQIYANGQPIADAKGTVGADGSVSYMHSPTAKTIYYVKITDPDYTVAGGSCGSSNSANETVDVDPKPLAGTLVITNAAATDNGTKLTANKNETATFRIDGTTNGDLSLWWSKCPSSDNCEEGQKGSSLDRLLLGDGQMPETMVYIVATSGICEPDTSNEVHITVELGDKPTLGVGDICQTDKAQPKPTVPDVAQSGFDKSSVKWYRRQGTAGEWTEITTVSASFDNLNAITATDNETLAPGKYQYRYTYIHNSTQGEAISNEMTVYETSKPGTVSDDVAACQGSDAPTISISSDGMVGKVIGIEFTDESSSKTSISTNVNTYNVPTELANTGSYVFKVKNGECDDVPSEPVKVTVVRRPVAGTLSGGTVCFNDGTYTVSFATDHTGDLIKWKTSDKADGQFDPVAANENQTTYEAGPLTERLWVTATVNTHEACSDFAATTPAVAVAVYDTLEIKDQPVDRTAVGDGDVTFNTTGGPANMKYPADNGNYAAVSVGSYVWEILDENGQWLQCSGSDFTASQGSLVVKNAKNYKGRKFRCVLTSDPCGRLVYTKVVTITAVKERVPGITNRLTDCDCYYPTDSAIYFVTGSAGEGRLEYTWDVATTLSAPEAESTSWLPLTDYPTLEYTLDSNRIIFKQIGQVTALNIKWIRAKVKDQRTDYSPTTNGEEIKVCLQPKPSYTFKGDTVCAGEMTNFAYTASDGIEDRTIAYAYAYALPDNPSGFHYINVTDDDVTDMDNIKASSDATISVGDKTLIFKVQNQVLSIVSAIPAEADGMILRMEVRSCYTPKPLDRHTDTTIDVVLRVDSPVAITSRAKDTTVCAGVSFDMETGYAMTNTTIEGNRVTAAWYKVGSGKQDEKTYENNQDKAVYNIVTYEQTIGENNVWYVDLSTKYCPAVTDSITVKVRKTPFIDGDIAPAVICDKDNAVLTANIEASDPSDYTLQWYRKENGTWKPLADGADGEATVSGAKTNKLTVSNASIAQAGQYKLELSVNLESCKDATDEKETSVTVKVLPEITLDPFPLVTIKENSQNGVKVKVLNKALNSEYVTVLEPQTYKWSYAEPSNTGNFIELDRSQEDFTEGSTTTDNLILLGNMKYNGVFLKLKVTTDCNGRIETEWDTVKITDKFTITPDPSPEELCLAEGAEFTTSFSSSPAMVPETVQWSYSDDGSTWTPVPSTDQYVVSFNDTYTKCTLTVKNLTMAMNNRMFRAEASDASGDSDATDGAAGHVLVLKLLAPPAFRCTDVLAKDEPVVVYNGTPDKSAFTANTSCLPSPGYDYTYYKRYFTERDSTQATSGTTYGFEAVSDTGMHYIYFVVSNKCGSVYVTDSVRVINAPDSGPVTAIGTKPAGNPEDKPNVVGPENKNIDITVCDGDMLELAATYEGGPAESFAWQTGSGDNWSNVPLSSPYSLRNDTLVINPARSSELNGKQFRCLFEMPGNVDAIESPTITVHVNTTPNVSDIYVAIEDITNKDIVDPKLDTGQALPGGEVMLTAVGAETVGATKVCFYQAFLNEAGEVDSVHQLKCVYKTDDNTAFEMQLTPSAKVEDHDATWYYAQVWNDCGYDTTRPYQLRVFDELAIQWIPDTLIRLPEDGKWDHNAYPAQPGELVVLFLTDENEDTVQQEAHLWVCQRGEFTVHDTTLSGFMNPAVEEEPDEANPDRSSRWFYRVPGEEEWKVFGGADEFWFDNVLNQEGDLVWRVNEHKGNFGIIMPEFGNIDIDSFQFFGVGVNARYMDSTVILTLHVIPSLEKGSLKMEPEEVAFCNEGEAEFTLSSVSENTDLSKLTVDWQVKPAGSDQWSENIEPLYNELTYPLGSVGLDYNGYEVRAIAYGPCGSDTAYGKIVVNTPVAPGVELIGDTVCEGEELLLTAADTGQAGHSAFAWYVNGQLVPGATGETFDMSAYDTGTYTVKVVMTADLEAHDCVLPETAEAEVSVRVNPLPTVTAAIKDEQIKTGFSTEVWVVEPDADSYGYAWTPGSLLADSAQARTATVAFDRAGTYDFVVTATDTTTGCQATDTVTVEVLSNFKLDSIPTTVVTPPILPNDEGTLPGFPDDSYPFFGEGVTVVSTEVFYEDEAHVWICPGNEARIVIATSGGEKPVKYSWSRVDGNAYPRDTTGTLSGWDGTGASGTDYVIEDSIIVFFFPDSTTHQFNCHITEGAGSELDITVYVHYIVPERIYIEARPKTTSTRYYEDQAVYFHARPQRYSTYYWVRVIGEDDNQEVTDVRASSEAMYATSFKMEQPDERANQVWVSAIDRNGCRVWDSTSVELIKLPNVMIIGDPNRPIDDVIFPEFEVEITNMWGLRIKTFKDRNGNGSSRGWDGRTPSGVKVKAGTYYYKVKIPTLDGFVYMSGAVTVINR